MKKIPTFYHLVRPSHSSIKKILLKMFAMLIKNPLYISGVFIKNIKKCVQKWPTTTTTKKIQKACTSELQLKRTLIWVFHKFIHVMLSNFYLNRILKQKKTYFVEEEENEEIPNRKMKMKTTKKWKENCT